MLSIIGTYQNGNLKSDENISVLKPVNVIVTFLEDVDLVEGGLNMPEKILNLSNFSFAESQKNLASFKGSFSDAVIEERKGVSSFHKTLLTSQ